MTDIAGYIGLVLLGLLVLGALFVVLRNQARAGRLNARAIPFLMSVPALLVAVLVVSSFPQPRFEPSTIVAGLNGSGRTDAFYLEGSYLVTWSLQSPAGQPCQLSASLVSEQTAAAVQQLTAAPIEPSASGGDTRRLSPVAGARYYIDGTSNCEWRVTLTPVAGS